VTEIQFTVSQWLLGVSLWLPLGYSFGAGMVATVNPCGFAMLPAYLSLLLGLHENGPEGRSAVQRGLRALLVGGAVTAGFVGLFGAAGILVALGGSFLVGAMPWLGVLVGGALVLLGLWELSGGRLSTTLVNRMEERLIATLPTDEAGFAQGGLKLFVIFGLAYGVASLSCTLPIFLVVVGSALASGEFLKGAAQFMGYALGMGFVFTLLTLSAALFKGAMSRYLRRALPYMQHVSPALLLLAGGYIIYYWFNAVRSG